MNPLRHNLPSQEIRTIKNPSQTFQETKEASHHNSKQDASNYVHNYLKNIFLYNKGKCLYPFNKFAPLILGYETLGPKLYKIYQAYQKQNKYKFAEFIEAQYPLEHIKALAQNVEYILEAAQSCIDVAQDPKTKDFQSNEFIVNCINMASAEPMHRSIFAKMTLSDKDCITPPTLIYNANEIAIVIIKINNIVCKKYDATNCSDEQFAALQAINKAASRALLYRKESREDLQKIQNKTKQASLDQLKEKASKSPLIPFRRSIQKLEKPLRQIFNN